MSEGRGIGGEGARHLRDRRYALHQNQCFSCCLISEGDRVLVGRSSLSHFQPADRNEHKTPADPL